MKMLIASIQHGQLWLRCCLFIGTSIAGALNPAQADVAGVINDLRSGGCQANLKLAPVKEELQLQAVAKRVAAGAGVEQASKQSSYPATKMTVIHLSGYTDDAAIRQTLKSKYCKLLMDPDWRQLSTERRDGEWWIVLAARRAIPDSQNATAQEVLALVNAARTAPRQCGGKPFAATHSLHLNATLNKAALLHAEDMAKHGVMQHAGSDGSTPAQRLTRQGYRWKAAGENVAAGAGSAQEVVAGWLNSPGHCANIMSPDFTEMGTAFAVNTQDTLAVYWAQSFGTPRPLSEPATGPSPSLAPQPIE